MHPSAAALRSERRRRAVRLLDAGASVAGVARRVGAARSTVAGWYARWRASGTTDEARRGPPRRLPPAASRQLCAALLAPPTSAGVPGARWTLAGVAWWLERTTGVRYHRRHVGRLLRAVGWAPPPVGCGASHARLSVPAVAPDGAPLALWFAATGSATHAPRRSG